MFPAHHIRKLRKSFPGVSKHDTLHFAMTSTYRALFRGFFCPGLLGAAVLRRSSMLLALLMLVAGRLGGPLGGPMLWVETDRAMGGGTFRPSGPAD